MKAANGNVLITVDKLVDDQTSGGIFKDVRFNKHAKMTISGTVIAVPEWGNNEVLYQDFDGLPQNKIDAPRFHRASEFSCTGKVGDKCYFHYLTLEIVGNAILTETGEQIYRVPVSDVFCWVRDGEIIMNFNWVLGIPYFGEGIQDLGGVKAKTKIVEGMDQPLVTEVVFKPQVDMAILKHIGPGIYEQRAIDKETLCLLTPSSEFENEIEGVKYWTFKHEDIIAIRQGDQVNPAADYCLVQTDRSITKKVIVDERYLASAFTGTFVQGGERVEGYKRGDRVAYAKKDVKIMMVNLMLMKAGNIQATL